MKIEKVYFWPAWFYHDQLKIKKSINKNILTKLGQANLDLWQALNIYDDFLDQEGRPSDLPLGNKYYRHFLAAYYELRLPESFYALLKKILDQLDKTNRSEVIHCRAKINKQKIVYPKYLPSWKNLERLSAKSLALALGPIALLYISEFRQTDKIKAALNFFRYALAAKQLADDACDWQDDLNRGFLTPANALIIKAARKKRLILDLRKNLTKAKLLFALEASAPISNQISRLCQKARQAGQQADLKPNGYLINNIIKPLEAAVGETTKFRQLLAMDSKKML